MFKKTISEPKNQVFDSEISSYQHVIYLLLVFIAYEKIRRKMCDRLILVILRR